MVIMIQGDERAARAWHAEWGTLTEICRLTCGGLKQAVNLTTDLEVDVEHKGEKLNMASGLMFVENDSLILPRKMGKEVAHELLTGMCNRAKVGGRNLKEILVQETGVMEYLDRGVLETLFNTEAKPL